MGMGGHSMVKKMSNGFYRQTNLSNESTEYLSKREEVRLLEGRGSATKCFHSDCINIVS